MKWHFWTNGNEKVFLWTWDCFYKKEWFKTLSIEIDKEKKKELIAGRKFDVKKKKDNKGNKKTEITLL